MSQQHVVVTMFQVFLVLVTVGLIVGTTSALKAAWARYMGARFKPEAAPLAAEQDALVSDAQTPTAS